MFGCPYEGFSGKGAKMAHEKPADNRSITRTCPEAFTRHPVIAQVWNLLADYRRGALGPVQRLQAPLLTLLRVLDAAEAEKESVILEALREPAR